MPYRNLCNGICLKNPEVRSELTFKPSHFASLHIRYGVPADSG
jgi:hypothetical protein